MIRNPPLPLQTGGGCSATWRSILRPSSRRAGHGVYMALTWRPVSVAACDRRPRAQRHRGQPDAANVRAPVSVRGVRPGAPGRRQRGRRPGVLPTYCRRTVLPPRGCRDRRRGRRSAVWFRCGFGTPAAPPHARAGARAQRSAGRPAFAPLLPRIGRRCQVRPPLEGADAARSAGRGAACGCAGRSPLRTGGRQALEGDAAKVSEQGRRGRQAR